MLTDIFHDQLVFIALTSAAVLLTAAACFVLARRARTRPWSWAGLGAAVTAVLALTLFLPGDGVMSDSGQCVINPDLAEPFTTEQGRLNLAFFVPVGLFGVLAVRRLLPVVAGGIGLSLSIELVQTLTPGIVRACDSSDLQMNGLGAVIGALAAWGALRAARRELPSAAAAAKPTTLAAGGALVVTAAVWAAFITPTSVYATTMRVAGEKEREAAEDAVTRAFGDRYTLDDVQVASGSGGAPSSLWITTSGGGAELSWPDASRFTAQPSSGFPVEGVTAPPADEQEAIGVARRYAEPRYPWIRGAEARADAVGGNADQGWKVSLRHLGDGGIVLPSRVDVHISAAGHIAQLLVLDMEEPDDLPEPTVDRERAAAVALQRHGLSEERDGVRVRECELHAMDRDGGWAVEWVCAMDFDDPMIMEEPVFVDALTGQPQHPRPMHELSVQE